MRVVVSDPEYLLHPQVDVEERIGPEVVPGDAHVALVDEAVAVLVRDAARVEGGAALPAHDAAHLDLERNGDRAVRDEDVGYGQVRRAAVGFGVVVVAEAGSDVAGEEVVVRSRAGVGDAERVAPAESLPERDDDTVVVDPAVVGDLAAAAARRRWSGRSSGLPGATSIQVRDAPREEVAASSMHVAHREAHVLGELLLDADGEGAGPRSRSPRSRRDTSRLRARGPRGKNESTRSPTIEPPGTSKNSQSVPG